jgi:NADH dehydrogenase
MVVTGANGFIGQHLVSHFADAGWDVRSLARPDWELTQPLGSSLTGAEVVVHTALVPYARPKAHDLNVSGSRMVIEEVRAQRGTRLIFLSSVSARATAGSSYARDKYEIQSMLNGPFELAVRPGLVLGNGGLFDRIRSVVARGRIVPLVGGGHQRVQTVHIDDLVQAIDAAIRTERAGVLTIAESTPVEFRTLLAECARQMNRHVFFVSVPARLVGMILSALEGLGFVLPVSRDNLIGLQSTETADVGDDLRTLGVSIRDYRASLQSIVNAQT